MPYKEVGNSGVWDWDANETFEGYKRGSEEAEGQNGKMYLKFDMEELNTKAHYKMWGSVLESKLGPVPNDTQVKIDYKGMAKGKGGNRFRDFSVQSWEA